MAHPSSDVTKTSKGRQRTARQPDAAAAAQRLQRGLGAAYSKRKFVQAWAKVQRDVGRGDKSFVFHVTRHSAASFLANDLQQPTTLWPSTSVVTSRRLRSTSMRQA